MLKIFNKHKYIIIQMSIKKLETRIIFLNEYDVAGNLDFYR